MEDMLKRIIEIDSMETKIVNSAEDLKAKAEETTKNKKQKLKDEYLEHAKKRIELMREGEKINAEEFFKNQSEKNEKMIADMNAVYQTKSEEWTDLIFNRVIKG